MFHYLGLDWQDYNLHCALTKAQFRRLEKKYYIIRGKGDIIVLVCYLFNVISLFSVVVSADQATRPAVQVFVFYYNVSNRAKINVQNETD